MLESVIQFFTKIHEALPRLALWRALRAPLVSGWVPGRFPHVLSPGAFRRDYFLYIPDTVGRLDRVPFWSCCMVAVRTRTPSRKARE